MNTNLREGLAGSKRRHTDGDLVNFEGRLIRTVAPNSVLYGVKVKKLSGHLRHKFAYLLEEGEPQPDISAASSYTWLPENGSAAS